MEKRAERERKAARCESGLSKEAIISAPQQPAAIGVETPVCAQRTLITMASARPPAEPPGRQFSPLERAGLYLKSSIDALFGGGKVPEVSVTSTASLGADLWAQML